MSGLFKENSASNRKRVRKVDIVPVPKEPKEPKEPEVRYPIKRVPKTRKKPSTSRQV